MGTEPHRFFAPFRLDRENAQLWRGDQEIRLRRKTFDVLLYLVDHPGELVTKAALLDAIWADVTVSDSMPATYVAELRKALGDEARVPRFIETVHGRGYRFIAKVETPASVAPIVEAPSVPKGPRPIMVGREDELALLQSWYSHAAEGQRQVIFVTGEAGIGKTTFVQAFLDSIAQEGSVRIGRGQCVDQYGAGEPYMPVLEALGRLCQEPGGERLIELLNRFAPTWLAQMPALLTSEERVRLQSEMQGVTQQRMLREMTQALEAIATETPLVLLLEDLHWSDFSTLELISAIARRSELARLLIVGTYRPVEMLANDHPLRTMKQELELHRYCEELRLKLLTEENVVDYLAKSLTSDTSQRFDSVARVIHARTEGNPLFMVNMVDYLLDDAGLPANSLEVSAADWAETLHVYRLYALRSIRQMIERNLERLQAEEQMVLEGASVVGVEFSSASVAAALERPQEEVESCCLRLSRREQFVSAQGSITWPDGTVAAGFRFHHALYPEVLYDLLPAGRQVQLHRRIAVREELGYGKRAGEVAAELAHHYSRANDKHKAIQYLRLAGDRAGGRGAVVEAENHYRSALKLLSELPQTTERDRLELALEMELGNVLWRSRSWAHSEASRAYARSSELAEKLGETNQVVKVLSGLVVSALGGGQFKLAHDLAGQMLLVAERSGDRTSLCAAHAFLGESLIWRAQYIEAQKHLESGSNYYDEADPAELAPMGIHAPTLGAIAVLLLGFPDRAAQLIKVGLRRAEHRDDPFWLGLVHLWAGIFRSLLRDAQGTLEHAKELRRLAAKQPVWTGYADSIMGQGLMLQGNWEEGGSYLRKADALHKSAGLVSQLMRAKVDEAELFAHEGRIDAGLALIADAVNDSEELLQIRSPALRGRAELLAQSAAEVPAVETAYRAAVECARLQGSRYYELQATTSFARWLRSQGRKNEAQTMLTDIYGWFTEGQDAPALSDAKALLDELTSKPSAPRRSNKSRRDPSRPV